MIMLPELVEECFGPLLKCEAKGNKICCHHVCANFTPFFEELPLYFRQKARAQIHHKGVESSEFGKHWKGMGNKGSY